MDENSYIKNALERERAARKEAERITEEKSLELYEANAQLTQLNISLEEKIKERTKEIQDSHNELLIAKEKAEEATRSKSSFLSNMSHEIRTPLNAITGLIGLLVKNEMDNEKLEMLNSIKFSADNLLHIINEILDFSKIESGKTVYEKISFKPEEIINSLYQTYSLQAKEKKLDYSIHIDNDIPTVLKGDPVKLSQILSNILGNAFKFTKEGFISLKVGKSDTKDNTVRLTFIISDSGIGMNENQQKLVFDSFTQAESGISRKYGGTGLGLSISKSFTEGMGGKISLDSNPGQGSTFTVELPFEISRTEAKEKEAIDRKALKGFKVLVVEDNTINQFVAGKILGLYDIHPDFAADGSEALDLLSKKGYDLIFMDLHMPVMGGFECSRKIRKGKAGEKNKNIPIIALSADAFENARQEVMEAGMNDFVTKPIKEDALYSVLLKYYKTNDKT